MKNVAIFFQVFDTTNVSQLKWYTNSLVNADSFYANFTNKTFQMKPIPHLTCTMKQKVLH